MRPIAADFATWRGLCACAGHAAEPSKTAEPIEIPFGDRLMPAQGTVYYIVGLTARTQRVANFVKIELVFASCQAHQIPPVKKSPCHFLHFYPHFKGSEILTFALCALLTFSV